MIYLSAVKRDVGVVGETTLQGLVGVHLVLLRERSEGGEGKLLTATAIIEKVHIRLGRERREGGRREEGGGGGLMNSIEYNNTDQNRLSFL